MKRILLSILGILFTTSLAMADVNFNNLAIFPTTVGVNWTIPYKTSDIFIAERSGANWTEFTCWNTAQNETLNWTNPYRIQAGSSWHIQDIWSASNVCAIRTQTNAAEVDVLYTVAN
jgi:hypothetical protein